MTKAQRPPNQRWFTVSCKFAHDAYSPLEVLQSVGWSKSQAKREAQNLRIWNPMYKLESPMKFVDRYWFDHGQALFLVKKGHHSDGSIPLDEKCSASTIFVIPDRCPKTSFWGRMCEWRVRKARKLYYLLMKRWPHPLRRLKQRRIRHSLKANFGEGK